ECNNTHMYSISTEHHGIPNYIGMKEVHAANERKKKSNKTTHPLGFIRRRLHAVRGKESTTVVMKDVIPDPDSLYASDSTTSSSSTSSSSFCCFPFTGIKQKDINASSLSVCHLEHQR